MKKFLFEGRRGRLNFLIRSVFVLAAIASIVVGVLYFFEFIDKTQPLVCTEGEILSPGVAIFKLGDMWSSNGTSYMTYRVYFDSYLYLASHGVGSSVQVSRPNFNLKNLNRNCNTGNAEGLDDERFSFDFQSVEDARNFRGFNLPTECLAITVIPYHLNKRLNNVYVYERSKKEVGSFFIADFSASLVTFDNPDSNAQIHFLYSPPNKTCVDG